LTIAGAQVSENGTYAMLFDGSGGSFGTRLPDELFTLCQSDGGDICFTSDSAGTTQLPVELVSIDTGAKKAEIWVAVPLTSSDTTIYVWYQSNAGTLTQPTASGTYGSQAVWTAVDSVGTWHLGETGSGSASDYKDSSATGNNSTSTANQPTATTGHIGGGQSFAAGNAIDFNGTAGSNLPTGDTTVSFWFNSTQSLGSGGEGYIIWFGALSTNQLLLIDLYNPSGTGVKLTATQDGSSVTSGNGYNDGTWRQATVTKTGNSWVVYVDGVQRGSGTMTTATTLSLPLRFGKTSSLGYAGLLDEVRIVTALRSANYVATDHSVQSSTTLVTVGTPESTTIFTEAASDTLTVTETAVCYTSTHRVSASDTLTIGEIATGHDTTQHLSATDTLTIAETAACHNTIQHASSTDTLTIIESAHETIPRTYSVSASDALSGSHTVFNVDTGLYYTVYTGLQEFATVVGPRYVTASDSLAPSGIRYDPVSGLPYYVYGLLESVTASQQRSRTNGDRLSIGESASVQVVHPGGIVVSASDALTISEAVYRAYPETAVDALELGELAIAEASKPVSDTLVIGESAHVNVIRNLSASDALTIEESFAYIKPYALMKRDYHPFVGGGNSSIPATLTIPTPGKFTLFWPATGTPTDVLTLRDPEFGNKCRLAFTRISRETRGGTLVVYADPL